MFREIFRCVDIRLHGLIAINRDKTSSHAFGIIIYICNMKGIVITAKNSSEFKFLSELLKKLGISSTLVSVEEMEDIGLYKLMKSADRNKKVSREKIMSKLKS